MMKISKVCIRIGPSLRFWICILIIFMKYPSSVISRSFDSCTIVPAGMIQVHYGQPLEIFCITTVGTAENLKFQLKEKIIPSEIVNSTTRRLYIDKPQKQINIYSCRNYETNIINVIRVLVDSPPPIVADFSCISKKLDELSCDWTSPKQLSIINYSLSFSIMGHSFEPCIAARTKEIVDKWFCSWSTTSKPKYKQMEYYYDFHLTSCNFFGCNQQNFTVNHYSIVKPDPPTNLRVVRNNAHGVLLQWNIPYNMVEFLPCPIVHKIEYQIAKINKPTDIISVDASSLPPRNRTNKLWLSNLPYAHMQYDVRIYIKSAQATEEKFWSDFAHVVIHTSSERPSRAPDTPTGSFKQALVGNKRVIIVYWKLLEEYEEAGKNFTYEVRVEQGTSAPQISKKEKNLGYVVLNNATRDSIDITIRSTNEIGASEESSHLYIPAQQDTEGFVVEPFTMRVYDNGTYVLSWVADKNVDNYTLFWCPYRHSYLCGGRLDFIVLDPNTESYVIDLPTDYWYQFAISANAGTKSSGMIWAMDQI